MILLLLVSLVIICLSFLASSMEAALFSVTPLQVERMVKSELAGSRRLQNNKEHISDSIIAIVILNNLSNIAGSIGLGALAVEIFGQLWVGVFSAVLTFIIIILGEVVPKTIGERHAASYARHTSHAVMFLRILLYPVIWMIRLFTRPETTGNARNTITEEEIALLAGMSHRHGNILAIENKLIRNALNLDTVLARDIMTPRTVVFALQASNSLTECSDELYTAPVSRIPVYDEDLDDIRGIVHLRTLLTALAKGKGERTLREYMEDVSFVPDTARANVLLRDFQKNREHLAVVVDEHGGMAGVITLEDILEQLVGEIVDEHDRDVDLRLKARMLVEQNRRERGHVTPTS
jgi:CBS domain containing-hemolysin-like protein